MTQTSIYHQKHEELLLDIRERAGNSRSKVIFVNDRPESLAWISQGIYRLHRQRKAGEISDFSIDLVCPRWQLAEVFQKTKFFRDVLLYDGSSEDCREDVFRAISNSYDKEDYFSISRPIARRFMRNDTDHWLSAYSSMISDTYPMSGKLPVFMYPDTSIGHAVNELTKSADLGVFHGHYAFILSFDPSSIEGSYKQKLSVLYGMVSNAIHVTRLPVFVFRKAIPSAFLLKIQPYVHVVDPKDIWELCYWIAGSRVVITHESWYSHLTAAFRRWCYVMYSHEFLKERKNRQYKTPWIRYNNLPSKPIEFTDIQSHYIGFLETVSDYQSNFH